MFIDVSVPSDGTRDSVDLRLLGKKRITKTTNLKNPFFGGKLFMIILGFINILGFWVGANQLMEAIL